MEEVERRLQAAGVPASGVHNSPEAVSDPQLVHRGHFVTVDHPTHGQCAVESSRFRLSRTPARLGALAPTFGDSTQWVLETVLGYDAERCAQLGEAIAQLLADRPERVAIYASGGLSHFPGEYNVGWIDRSLDHWILERLERNDLDALKQQLDRVENGYEKEREDLETRLTAAGRELEALDRRLTELGSAVVSPLRGRPELGDLVARLEVAGTPAAGIARPI